MASVRAPRLSVTTTVIVVVPPLAANSLLPAATVITAGGRPDPPDPVMVPLERLFLLLLESLLQPNPIRLNEMASRKKVRFVLDKWIF